MPVGVGSEGSLTLRAAEMDKMLKEGMAYVEELGLCWPEDRTVTEETVSATHMCTANQVCVGSCRAKIGSAEAAYGST